MRSCKSRRNAPRELFEPFDIEADYLAYVDGRTRQDGIRSFLAARRIDIPEGSEQDPEDADTIWALGARKMRRFLEALRQGITPTSGAETLLKRLRQLAVRTAVGSSSENCEAILHAAGLAELVDVRVDGLDVEKLGFPGKPDPALFLEAARRLGIPPSRAILFEDALAGVEAGRRGNFGRVIGIDKHAGQQGRALRRQGADAVIQSLLEVEVAER